MSTFLEKLFMDAQTLVNDLPVADILGTAEMGDPNLSPPIDIANITHLALTQPDCAISDGMCEFFNNWVTEQKAIQQLAKDTLERLEKYAPPPSPEGIMNSTAIWPEWMFQWWGSTLRFPWAGRLGEAVAAAWEWLDGQP